MLNPLATPEEQFNYGLALANSVIDAVDPEQKMSEAQGAVLAVAASKRAVEQWDPSKTEFEIYFRLVLQRSLSNALERGNTATYGDACLELLDQANNR